MNLSTLVLIFLALDFQILILGKTDLDQALRETATRIASLQELETRMAKEYGTIDAAEVFQETDARALSRGNEQSVSALKTLNTLCELCLEFPFKRGALRYRVKHESLITSITVRL